MMAGTLTWVRSCVMAGTLTLITCSTRVIWCPFLHNLLFLAYVRSCVLISRSTLVKTLRLPVHADISKKFCCSRYANIGENLYVTGTLKCLKKNLYDNWYTYKGRNLYDNRKIGMNKNLYSNRLTDTGIGSLLGKRFPKRSKEFDG